MYRALWVPTAPIFLYYYNWVKVGCFQYLILSNKKWKVSIGSALQFIQAASEKVARTDHVDDRVEVVEPPPIALRPSVVHFT